MPESQPPGAGHGPLLTVSYDLVTPYASRRGLMLPIVQAAIEFPSGEFQSVHALVDTGAEMSLFDGAVAVGAGADPAADFIRVVPIAGIGGATGLYAYVHRVRLLIGSPTRYRSLAVEVGFTHPRVELAMNVLGRRGFLDCLRVGLDGTAIPPLLYLGFTV